MDSISPQTHWIQDKSSLNYDWQRSRSQKQARFKRWLSLKKQIVSQNIFLSEKGKVCFKKTVKVKAKCQVKYVVFKEEWMVQENQRRQVVRKQCGNIKKLLCSLSNKDR